MKNSKLSRKEKGISFVFTLLALILWVLIIYTILRMLPIDTPMSETMNYVTSLVIGGLLGLLYFPMESITIILISNLVLKNTTLNLEEQKNKIFNIRIFVNIISLVSVLLFFIARIVTLN